MEPNEWLTNQEFLQNVKFYDKYYFQSLCLYIDNFIKNVPVPVITTWDYKHKQIYFKIGNDFKYFEVNVNIAYKDYITLVERWLKQFYPKYEVEIEKEIPLSDNEVWKKVKKEGMKLNDVILLVKKVKEKECAIIEKVFFREDKFIININGVRYLRITGTSESSENLCPISKFLPAIREIKKDIDKKNYIFNNSIEIKKLIKKQKIEEINYLGFQMKNFVKINYFDIKSEKFKQINTRKWKWGNYILNIEASFLEEDILNFLKSKKIEIIFLEGNDVNYT